MEQQSKQYLGSVILEGGAITLGRMETLGKMETRMNEMKELMASFYSIPKDDIDLVFHIVNERAIADMFYVFTRGIDVPNVFDPDKRIEI